jgi:hypothetical protein
MSTKLQLGPTIRAVLLGLPLITAPLLAEACTVESAKPFTSGPLDAEGLFSEYVVDVNGVALQICTDSYTADGNPAPCFYDPVEIGVPLSERLGRGGEAFMFLAGNDFTSPGRSPVTATIVMGVETAFLGPIEKGFQTQFQRLRTRVNVDRVGHYKVETPWGNKTYTVTTLLRPGGGQSRMEISDPIDIDFQASSTVNGLVAPFLIADQAPGLRAEDRDLYIGDGVTPTTVTGSPCGDNFIRITAVGLDGVTPIPINTANNAEGDPINVFTSRLFTVQGKKAPLAEVPLAITGAYYSTSAGSSRVTVMAEGSTSATQASQATVDVLGLSANLEKEGSRFYATVTVPAFTLPQTISVTATDTGILSMPNTKTAALTDLVTVSKAEAVCSGIGADKQCTLSVIASSSDDGTGLAARPQLTLKPFDLSLNYASPTVAFPAYLTVNSAALPASVTVVSSNGGAGTRRVTVINQ